MTKPRSTHDRRAFLRGAAGLILTLPMLEMTHGTAWAAGGGTPKRFIVVFRHGGTASNIYRYKVNAAGRKVDGKGDAQGANLWNPTDPSQNLVLGPIHSTLQAHKSKLLVVSGVDNAAGLIQSPNMGAHLWSNSTSLTAARAIEGISAAGKPYVYAQGPSIDHVLATRLNGQSPRPFASVRAKVSGHQYGTPFYAGPNQGIGSYTSPAKAFDAYLGGVSAGKPDPEVIRRRAMGLSVLDGVSDGYRQLQPKLSAQDRQVVDAHLTHLSELEARIKAYETQQCPAPPVINRSILDADAENVGPIMVDIILAALRCGLTQVATLDLSDIITTWLPQPWGGLPRGHELHHLGRDVGATGDYASMRQRWLDEMLVNRKWCMGLFQRLLKGLDSVVEGNGTMLDNSLMLYTSEFSNGSVHSVNDVPILLAGSAGGYFKTGRHINCNVANAADKLAYQSRTGTHNLYTSILNAFGFPDTHFGADLPGLAFKGPIPGLT